MQNFVSIDVQDLFAMMKQSESNHLVDGATGSKSTNCKEQKGDAQCSQIIEKLVDKTTNLNLNDFGRKETYSGENMHVTTYKAEGCPGFVLHVKHPSKFQIIGYLKVRTVGGGVKMFGYDLTSSCHHSSICMYSSELFQSYQISTHPSFICDNNEVKVKCRVLLPPTELKTLLESIRKHDSILYVEQIHMPRCGLGDLANPYTDSLRLGSSLSEEFKNCRCIIAEICHDHYETAISIDQWERIKPGKRTIAVGPSQIGKSSLVKFVANKLLTNQNKVIYFDLNLGQGEFSPPGSIGVYLLSTPLFGPNFIHNQQPQLVFHVGVNNVFNNSKRYINCIKSLVKFVNTDARLRSLPRLINTMAFFKGLGETVMRAVLTIFRPTTLIQLYRDESTITDIMDFKNLFPKDNVLHRETGLNSNYDLYLIKSVALSDRIGGPYTSNKAARKRMLLAHMGQMLEPPFYTFDTVTPYKIPLSTIVIGVNEKEIAHDVIKLLDNCLVSLTRLPEAFEFKNVQGLKVLLKPQILPCMALGVVKEIDLTKQQLFLCTYLPAYQIENVELLTISNIQLPSELNLKQHFNYNLISQVPDIVKPNVTMCQTFP